MNKINKCPICESEQFSLFMNGTDYSFTQEQFDIVQCESCRFKFTNPIPEIDQIGKYYKADNYISHTSSKKGIFEQVYHIIRGFAIKQKFKLVDLRVNGPILDVGCGTGDFLKYAQDQGRTVLGLEPDDQARDLAAQKQVEVKSTEHLANLEANSFSAITMWHVLEHVYNLNEDLAKLTEVLKDDGYLFVAVPNCSSHDAKHYKEYWAAYDLPIHLYHFVPQDMENLAAKHGLELVEVIPMKFDSYYVSMLSEKYKSGNEQLSILNMMKGFFIGWISNLNAKQTSYSSQIYILKHKKSAS